MSAAEKQRGYRERQKVRRIEQLMRPGEMSRVTLISGLGYCLAALDDPETSAVMRETFQGVAQGLLAEIATRYQFDGLKR